MTPAPDLPEGTTPTPPASAPDWRALIEPRIVSALTAPTVTTVLQVYDSFSKPARVLCDDLREYVVKGPHLGRATVNEQIVGRLGHAIGCPIPPIHFVTLPDGLAEEVRKLAHPSFFSVPGVIPPAWPGGQLHALAVVPKTTNRQWLQHAGTTENRPRFAALSILFGWIPNLGDFQVIYEQERPNRVYSVDHGHFFPRGPNWRLADLALAPPPAPMDQIVRSAGLTWADLAPTLDRLRILAPEHVAGAVAAPLASWAITLDERAAVADYLWQRREAFLASAPAIT